MVWLWRDRLYVKELFYKKGLTNPDIVKYLKNSNVNYNDLIIADSSEPKSIEEIKRLGYRNIKPVKKIKNSINLGIDILKRYDVRVVKPSPNLITEFQNKPKDEFNHGLDALRYVALYSLGVKNKGGSIVLRTL